ncbi:hypothetical protein [Algirhabdus cladophorae]|uniref:hypothetical protein n=1 Tax=Algirhabdus cladophorae TaxID=3377108 RepID=UPI003B846586
MQTIVFAGVLYPFSGQNWVFGLLCLPYWAIMFVLAFGALWSPAWIGWVKTRLTRISRRLSIDSLYLLLIPFGIYAVVHMILLSLQPASALSELVIIFGLLFCLGAATLRTAFSNL